jgi:hypothetical protein
MAVLRTFLPTIFDSDSTVRPDVFAARHSRRALPLVCIAPSNVVDAVIGPPEDGRAGPTFRMAGPGSEAPA